jgi:hypothetical protein
VTDLEQYLIAEIFDRIDLAAGRAARPYRCTAR